jgi:hypothetical protein
VFGKSITRPPKPRARQLEPVPALPHRTFAFAFVAVIACAYAIARHYTRHDAPPPAATPRVREIPAPDLVPIER